MKKFILGLVLGFVITAFINIYTLEINGIEETENRILVNIKTFGYNFNYYYEK